MLKIAKNFISRASYLKYISFNMAFSLNSRCFMSSSPSIVFFKNGNELLFYIMKL